MPGPSRPRRIDFWSAGTVAALDAILARGDISARQAAAAFFARTGLPISPSSITRYRKRGSRFPDAGLILDRACDRYERADRALAAAGPDALADARRDRDRAGNALALLLTRHGAVHRFGDRMYWSSGGELHRGNNPRWERP